MKKQIGLMSALLLGAGLALASPGPFWRGWALFSLLSGLALWTLAWAAQKALPDGRPLLALVLLAFFLRLGAGVALNRLLPLYGYDNPIQNNGYVFYDAFRRDTQAWDLAQSEQPLMLAFSPQTATDQYGGLLFVSAWVYRYLSPDAHRALLVVLLAVWVALLGLPFLWRLGRTYLEPEAAWLAVLIYAFYPEAILLSASQMREPFLMSGVIFLSWGMERLVRAAARQDAFWPLGSGLLILFLFSPGVAAFALLGLLIFTTLTARRRFPAWILWIAGGLMGLFALAFFAAQTGSAADGMLSGALTWLKTASTWDMYLLNRSSGWVQKLFNEMPARWYSLFVVVFGLTQPVLPATLLEPSASIWRVVHFLRALGWYALVPLLFLAVALAGRERSLRGRKTLALALFSWAWIVLAAWRAGGDQWDNPRYRVIFLAWQALAAAQAWVWARRRASPWLWRILSAEGVFLLFFTDWYVSRYTGLLPRLSFWRMLVSIFLLTALLWAGDNVLRWWKTGRDRAS